MSDDTTAPVTAEGAPALKDSLTAEGLRERIAEKLWNDEQLVPWSRVFGNPDWRHDLEVHFERVDELLAEISPVLDLLRSDAVAALAGDPGDLPARMAEAIGAAIKQRDASERPGDEYGPMSPHLAEAAMSVRWEDAVQLAAENAQLRAERDHAVGELSARADHNTRWETEKARADKAEAELEQYRARLAARKRPNDPEEIRPLAEATEANDG